MMRALFVAAALAWTIVACGPAAARDGLAVTMRAVLYEEDASNSQGDRAEGQVTWRVVPTTDAAAPAGDVTIRGDVEVPSRKLRLTLSIRRNFDATLPASHTMQIDFAPSLDFAGGSINRVMGLLMKANERAKGAPIAALSVKVDDRHFLIGLSAVPQDAIQQFASDQEQSLDGYPDRLRDAAPRDSRGRKGRRRPGAIQYGVCSLRRRGNPSACPRPGARPVEHQQLYHRLIH